MKKATVLLPFWALTVAFFIGLAPQAFASVIVAEQFGHEATSTTGITSFRQPIGTGYTSAWTGTQMFFETIATNSGNQTIKLKFMECDVGYASCVQKGVTTGSASAVAVGTVDFSLNLSTSTPYTMNPLKYYELRVDEGGITYTGTTYITGTQLTPTPQPDTCTTGCGGLTAAAYVVYSDFAGTQFGIGYATSSSLFSGNTASTTLEQLSLDCALGGNLFSQGICVAFSYLFVPPASVLNQWAAFPQYAETRFPFSWVASTTAIFSGFSASTTSNFITVSYDFAGTNMSSSSVLSLPRILPTLTVFSSTTIETYLSPTTWSLIQALIAASLWLAFGLDVFYTVRNSMHQV